VILFQATEVIYGFGFRFS